MEEENVIAKDMTPILLEDLGMRYPTEKSRQKYRYSRYQCQYCGGVFECMNQNVTKGRTRSCGCLYLIKYENSKIHGLATHPLYNTWHGMLQRCNNPKATGYKHYGARGIKVCDRWLDVANFIMDMYQTYLKGLTLDRININGNYEIENCRWTTPQIQGRNTKDIQINNTSGYRGVVWHRRDLKWFANIRIDGKRTYLGYYNSALEAAKAYERYVRLNNLEHNFTPALLEEEIEELYRLK